MRLHLVLLVFLTAWAGAFDVVAAAEAVTVGPRTVIAGVPNREEYQLHSVMRSDGKIIYTWSEAKLAGGDIIKGRVYDPTTGVMGPVVVLANARSRDGYRVQPWNGYHDILRLRDGRLAFAWFEMAVSGTVGPESIWIRHLTQDLRGLDAPVRVVNGFTNQIEAVATENGRIAIVYSNTWAGFGSIDVVILSGRDFKIVGNERSLVAGERNPQFSMAKSGENSVLIASPSLGKGEQVIIRGWNLDTRGKTAISGPRDLLKTNVLNYFKPVLNPTYPSGVVMSLLSYDLSGVQNLAYRLYDRQGTALTPIVYVKRYRADCYGAFGNMGVRDAVRNPPVVQTSKEGFAIMGDLACVGEPYRKFIQYFTPAGLSGDPIVVAVQPPGTSFFVEGSWTLDHTRNGLVAAYIELNTASNFSDTDLVLNRVSR